MKDSYDSWTAVVVIVAMLVVGACASENATDRFVRLSAKCGDMGYTAGTPSQMACVSVLNRTEDQPNTKLGDAVATGQQQLMQAQPQGRGY